MATKTKPVRTPTKASLGLRLRAAREAAGLSQLELGYALQIQPQHISAYERGTREMGALRLGRLAAALGVSADELLRG